jgi:hypothetical protein
VAQLSRGQFKGLHEQLGTDGGFTVNPFTGEAVTKGISVAPHGNELRVPAAQTSPEMVANYHSDIGNQERFDRGASFGGWRHSGSGDDFLDTPTVYKNNPGGQRGARNQMIKSNQIAAFRLDDFQELINPYHKENQSLEISAREHTPEDVAAWVEMPRNGTKGKGAKITPTEGMSFS